MGVRMEVGLGWGQGCCRVELGIGVGLGEVVG